MHGRVNHLDYQTKSTSLIRFENAVKYDMQVDFLIKHQTRTSSWFSSAVLFPLILPISRALFLFRRTCCLRTAHENNYMKHFDIWFTCDEWRKCGECCLRTPEDILQVRATSHKCTRDRPHTVQNLLMRFYLYMV